MVWVISLRGSRSGRERAGRQQIVVAAIALALLVVILLPAISLTDDRLAMASADIEHAFCCDDRSCLDISIACVPHSGFEIVPVAPVDESLKLGRSTDVLVLGQTLAGKWDTRAVRPPPSSSVLFA